MNKIKITFEIKSENRDKRRTSKFEKLVNAFVRIWKATLASNLSPSAMTKVLRLFVSSSTLLALLYVIVNILPLIFNRP